MDIYEHRLNQQIGMRIRKRRKELHLSQKQLASYLGVSFQQIQKYENGQNRISAAKLYFLGFWLGTDMLYFCSGYK